jgi:tetratricopeptide (TPR) repeat protein
VAEWIQEVARDRDVEAAELAAYHYGQALAYGEDDPEVTRRAVEALLTAGEAAYSRADMEAARAHVERALRFADNDSRPFAQLALTRLHYVDGQFVRALEELEAIEAQLDPDDAQLRSDMLAWRSRTCWLTGRWDEAFSSANEAVVALDGLPESLQLARALARRSQIEMLKHHDDAIPHAKEAIAVARRVDDVFAEVNARINLLSEQATLGIAPDPDDLIDIVDRAVEAGTYDEAYRAIVNFQWSAHGYIPLDETERVIAEARRHLADVPAPVSMAAYVELSTAAKLMLPTGRWAKVDDVSGSAYGLTLTAATSRLVWLMVAAGQAMRRGDLEAAAPLIEELQPAALASGEAQRIVPMACVVLPWLFLTNRSDELRWLADEVLTRLDGRWSAVLPAVPIVRALAAAGEPELLQRTIDSMGRTMKEAQVAKLGIALTAGEGVLALLERQAADAVEPLRAAVKAERDLGFVYDAACLELDLARAFEAQGRTDEADEARKRAAAVLEPLGVVNAF